MSQKERLHSFDQKSEIAKKMLENKTQKYHVTKIDENFVEG